MGNRATEADRREALFGAMALGAVSAFFSFYIAIRFAFSTMVDARIPRPERRRLIADQFLFSDGPWQIAVLAFFVLAATTCGVGCAMLGCHAICGRPSLRKALISSLLTGTVGTCGIFAVLWFLRA